MFNVKVNISQTVVGSVDIEQGSNVVFKVRVANVPYTDSDGVQYSADGLFVQSILPLGVSAVSWSATYSTGATGPASGTGQFVVQITTLAPGAYVDFTVTAKVTSLTEPPEFLRHTVFVSAPSAYCLLPTSKWKDEVEFSVIKNRVSITAVKATVGSYIRGKKATFTLTVTNTDSVGVDSLVVDEYLPAGFYLESWSAVLTGATGATYSDCFPAAIHHMNPGATVVYTITVLIGPDAVLGASTNFANVFLPDYLDSPTGTNCVPASVNFTVTDPVAELCFPISNCVQALACDDDDPIVGYAVVSLVTPDNVTPASLVSKKKIVQRTYRADMDETGCWETPPLPVNTFIISKCTGEPIPTYYDVLEYVGMVLLNRYTLRLDADTSYGSSVDVSTYAEEQ